MIRLVVVEDVRNWKNKKLRVLQKFPIAPFRVIQRHEEEGRNNEPAGGNQHRHRIVGAHVRLAQPPPKPCTFPYRALTVKYTSLAWENFLLHSKPTYHTSFSRLPTTLALQFGKVSFSHLTTKHSLPYRIDAPIHVDLNQSKSHTLQ